MTRAPCYVCLGGDVSLKAEGNAEACVLAEMGEGEIGQRGADAACVVEEKQADGIDDGDGVLGLDEDRVAIAEAVVGEAAEADLRVDVGAADGGLQIEGDGGAGAGVGDGEVGAKVELTVVALLRDLDDVVAGGGELFMTVSAGVLEDVIEEARAEAGSDVGDGNVAADVRAKGDGLVAGEKEALEGTGGVVDGGVPVVGGLVVEGEADVAFHERAGGVERVIEIGRA